MLPYCGRPSDFETYIQRGLKVLTKNDTLIHLGDVAWHDIADAHERFIVPLPCRKILVRGNHDRKSNNWYLKHGWDFVCRSFQDKYFGVNILFSHRPKSTAGCDLNIHGHFHNAVSSVAWAEDNLSTLKSDKHRLFVLEHHYKPVRLDKFIRGGVRLEHINI